MAEEEKPKRKRGRPRKNPLPEEIQTLVKETKSKEEEKVNREQIIQEYKDNILTGFDWDFKKDDPIEYFDATKSYELTGYRPINDKEGLDFDPEWFTEVRENCRRTGLYCSMPPFSKAWNDFFVREHDRCKNGMTVNGYTITGDHYFFLNYYKLMNTLKTKKAMDGRIEDFPNFLVSLYEYFHYIELCKHLRKNAILMKARGLGFSEINAATAANLYSCKKGSNTLIVASEKGKLTPTLEKLWGELSYLNDNTQLGFFNLRLVKDTADVKRASYYKIVNSLKVEAGSKAQLVGIVADSPDKVRGYRADLLIFEESGSFPNLRKAAILAEALLNIGGSKFGIFISGGTGGESRGAALEGLREMYYDPEGYGALPYYHNHTPDRQWVKTGYFLPAYSVVFDPPDLMDNRGYVNPEKGKEPFLKDRAKLLNNPKALVEHCAEKCFTAEEAFNLEGENKFNKVLIVEQLTRIRALKQCPPIDLGYIDYTYKNNEHILENINGFKWVPNKTSPLKILEHPIWTLPDEKDEHGQVIKSYPKEKINNLYVIGIDGIDIGASQTSEYTKDPSDFCLVVYKRTYGNDTPKFVALYKDRPDNIHTAYKTAIKLALYYNAKINIEATRMSFATWARDHKLLSFFMKRPRATLTDINRGVSKQYGTPATLAIIAHQTDLIADYVNDYCYNIWFEKMLEELNQYNDANKRKFDIVASMGMALLADEELSGTVPKSVLKLEDTWLDIGYYFDEKGNRRYGIIPTNKQKPIVYNSLYENYDHTGFRTSDPRYVSGFI